MKKQEFIDEETYFLQSVANLIAGAIVQRDAEKELTKINKQSVEENERTKELKREILNNSLKECWDLGGFLHDNLNQKLISMKVMADHIENELSGQSEKLIDDIRRIEELFDESVDEIRNLTRNIILVDIKEGDINHAFQLLFKHMEKTYEFNCILVLSFDLNCIQNRKFGSILYFII